MRFNVKTARYFRVLAVLSAGISLVPSGRAEHYKVYLLGGQSNASGRGDAAELSAPYDSPQTDVAFYWHKTLDTDNGNLEQDSWLDLQVDSGQGKNSPSGHDVEFGPEIAFGRTMADACPDDHIAIIKYAHGGSNLHTQWADGGEMYETFTAVVNQALASLTASGHTYQVTGMFWQQGEADTGTSYAGAYEENLTDLIARVRADFFGGLSLPFVVGGLSSNQYATVTDTTTGAGMVRLAQETVAQDVDGVGFADADNCEVYDGNEIHFNWEGQLALGAAHAAVMLELEAQDTDYDGLTAAQETALGTDPDNPDSDGDGQKDGFEYRAGTSPTNAASFFKVRRIAVSNDAVVLEWPSRSGNAYGVESSTNLQEWTEERADFPASGSNTVWTGADGETDPSVGSILAQYDIQAGENGDFNNEAFDSVDTESSTTAGRLVQGGSLTGGGSSKFVLTYGFFDASASGSPGLNLAGTAAASQSAAAAAGDWFSFTLEANGAGVSCESLSFYANQASSGALLDVSCTIGTTETFVLQGYESPGSNSDVELVAIDFDDFSTTNDVVWTFYLYGAAGTAYGNRFDDITLYGSSDAVIEDEDAPAAIFYRVRLQ